MDAIATLGTISGLALSSGLRLYSTILMVGLGIRLGWFTPPPSLSQLDVLASTPIIAIAAVLYVIEFLADKIPWLDTMWDSVHTFIRPIGAGVMTAAALGEVDPVVKTGAILLAGTVALSSHSAKAGTRLAANHSPEPFSNIGLSLGEDVLAVGGTWLALTHPLAMLVIVVITVGLVIWLVPRLFRALRRNVNRLRGLFGEPAAPASGNAILDRRQDQVAEGVDLVDRGVDVRRDPDP